MSTFGDTVNIDGTDYVRLGADDFVRVGAKKERRVEFKATEDDYQQWVASAKQAGLSLGEFIRRRVNR